MHLCDLYDSQNSHYIHIQHWPVESSLFVTSPWDLWLTKGNETRFSPSTVLGVLRRQYHSSIVPRSSIADDTHSLQLTATVNNTHSLNLLLFRCVRKTEKDDY